MSPALPFAREFAISIKAAEERRRAALARCCSPDLATFEALDRAFQADLDAAREAAEARRRLLAAVEADAT